VSGNESDRVEDGRTETIVLKYDSEVVGETWSEFLGRLRDVEVGWEVER
jgi:hypothetical protein